MRPYSSLLLCGALALLAGCATSPPPPTAAATGAQFSSDSIATQPSHPDSTIAIESGTLNPVLLKEPVAPHTVDLTAHADDVWDRIRMGFAIPNMDSPLVVEQQAWFLSHQDYLQRAVARSSHYIYHVVEELKKRGMPTELALLPFIESAYNPMAYSRAHASGMWQFIPTTGKNYNLKQDWWSDERRDVVASTDAALSYLQVLYQMHGDWTLALASYNWGEGAVKRAIEKNQAEGKPTDYLSLNMPDETRSYYPKLQALKNIIANPAAFGVVLPKIENEPYFVSVPRTRDMDVQTAAKFAEMPVEDFKALNPAFNRPVIASSHTEQILLPADRVAIFQAHLESNVDPLVTWEAYHVRRGERLDRIAAHFGMSVSALCQANSLGPRSRVRPGQELLVQRHGRALRSNASGESVEGMQQAMIVRASYDEPESETERGFSTYVVRRGDTLSRIAKRFHTTADAIRRENHLASNRLARGLRLNIVTTAPAPDRLARR